MIKPRERIRVLLFVVGTLLFLVLLWDVLSSPAPQAPSLEPASDETPDPELAPMDMVALDALAPLPDYETIKARAGDVDRLLEDPKLARYSLDAVDDLTFAWARARLQRDREDRPLMQAYSAEDLVFERVPHGRPVLVTGTLIEVAQTAVPGLSDERWVRGTIALGEDPSLPVFLHVLAPLWATPGDDVGGDGLSPGLELRVVGRYLGTGELPTAGGGTQSVPVVAASALRHAEEVTVTDLLALSSGGTDDVWRDDSTVYEGIDDYPGNRRQSVLERRPYYHLLGQVRLDASTPGVYDDARNMAEHSPAVRQTPSAFRGEVFTVHGKVWDAWFDEQVARDEPYGVDRVMRIWVYTTVFGVGEQPFRDLYELAVLAPGDAELPQRNQEIVATGRFLKVQLYHTPVSRFHHHLTGDDPTKNEDVLFNFLVAPEMTIRPDGASASYFWWKVAFLAIAGSFFLLMGYLVVQDERHDDDYRRKVRALRSSRRELRRRQRAADEAPAPGADDDPD